MRERGLSDSPPTPTGLDALSSDTPANGRPAVSAWTPTRFPQHTGSTRTSPELADDHPAAAGGASDAGGAPWQPRSAMRKMRPQRDFGLDLSWGRLTTVFLIAVAILALFSHVPDELQIKVDTFRIVAHPRWAGVVIVAMVAVAGLVTYRAAPLASALPGRLLDRFVNPESKLTQARDPAADHCRRYGSQSVGIREHRGQLAAVIVVADRRRERHEPESPAVLPVPLVAAGLRQFDVRLEGIDIVSVTPCDDTVGDDLTGQETGAPDRGMWVVLRMNPHRNVGAIAARDSVASTLAAAAERLAHDLDGDRVEARVATAEEFDDVDTAILAGLQPSHVRLRRRRLKQRKPKRFSSSFWVTPRDITSPNIERLYRPETDATVMTVRLTPRKHRTQVSVLVHYHSSGRLPRKTRTGLNRLTGRRQLTAIHSSLPTPMRHRRLGLPARELAGTDQLVVPLDPQRERPANRVRVSPRVVGKVRLAGGRTERHRRKGGVVPSVGADAAQTVRPAPPPTDAGTRRRRGSPTRRRAR